MAAAAAARACARWATARAAAKAPTRGLTTTDGASGAGPEEWGKASKLVDQLVRLMEKKTPTEAELTKIRVISEELSKVLKAPLTQALTMQEMKYLMIQSDVSELKASFKFHNSISYTAYGVLCCSAIALGTDDMRLHLQTNDNTEKIKQQDKRLALVEGKVHAL